MFPPLSLWGLCPGEHTLHLNWLRTSDLRSSGEPFVAAQWLSQVWLFATPWTAGRQASLSITNSRSSYPPSWWCHPTISSSVIPFSFRLQSFPASGSFPLSRFFASGGQSTEVQLQHQSFQWTPRTDFLWDWLVSFPCSSRDSQESSPTPQFKSISFLALSFLYSPTLTSIHDYWKNHSFD